MTINAYKAPAETAKYIAETCPAGMPNAWAPAKARPDPADRAAGRTGQSASRSCCPYLASLVSPTPLTLPSSASEDGDVIATSLRVASWKIT